MCGAPAPPFEAATTDRHDGGAVASVTEWQSGPREESSESGRVRRRDPLAPSLRPVLRCFDASTSSHRGRDLRCRGDRRRERSARTRDTCAQHKPSAPNTTRARPVHDSVTANAPPRSGPTTNARPPDGARARARTGAPLRFALFAKRRVAVRRGRSPRGGSSRDARDLVVAVAVEVRDDRIDLALRKLEANQLPPTGAPRAGVGRKGRGDGERGAGSGVSGGTPRALLARDRVLRR